MRKAIVYILYHPAALASYDLIRSKQENSVIHILVVCNHVYCDKESIDAYSSRFTHTICLQDIDYDSNMVTGMRRYYAFIKKARLELARALKDCGSFSVISDLSAYLPVNALLSELKKDRRFNTLISISEKYVFEFKPDLIRSIKAILYTFFLRLTPVYCHQAFGYMYFKRMDDKIIRVISPFSAQTPETFKGGNQFSYCIVRPAVERISGGKDTVIFYSDMQVREYGCELTTEIYKEKLTCFFKQLAAHYSGHTIVCKPHPLDGRKVMPGLEIISFELYEGSRISQMHLDALLGKVKACYSVASTSLLYSASLGIPSYTLFNYLQFKGKYPGEFFNAGNGATTPFSYNIRSLEEIGAIDSLRVEPVKLPVGQSLDDFLE